MHSSAESFEFIRVYKQRLMDQIAPKLLSPYVKAQEIFQTLPGEGLFERLHSCLEQYSVQNPNSHGRGFGLAEL